MRIVGWLGDVYFDIVELGDLLVAVCQVKVGIPVRMELLLQ